MFKVRSMIEEAAEKVFGRILPQVEAQAENCCSAWGWIGCCGQGGAKAEFYRYCPCEFPQDQYSCTGICPT